MIGYAKLPWYVSGPLFVTAGVLLGLGQAPIGWWPATIVGIGLFSWLLQDRTKRTAVAYGYVAGLALNGLTLWWISVLGAPVALALIGYAAIWYGLAGLIISRLIKLPGWQAWVACAWVAIEHVSGRWPFGGFSWIRLAHATLDQPLGGYLPFLGAAGASLLMALVGQLLFTRRFQICLPLMAALFLVGALLPAQKLPTTGRTVEVANVQPNVNRHEYGGPYYARAVTNNALSATVFALAEARSRNKIVDMVLWPESASDYDPLLDRKAGHQVELATKLAGTPLLVGAVTRPDTPENSRQTTGIFWEPEVGPAAVYHKRNLVPFGEWIPFRDILLPVFPVLRQTGSQSVPGAGPGVLSTTLPYGGTLRVGDIICFELAYDETVYDVARNNADIVVSQSNENTYAGTSQVPQQLALNRLRAIELGREVVASTLNSVSALAHPDGSLTDVKEEYRAAAAIVSVPVRSGQTWAPTIAPWLSQGACLVTLGAIVWVLAAAWRQRGRLVGPSSKEV